MYYAKLERSLLNSLPEKGNIKAVAKHSPLHSHMMLQVSSKVS